MVASDTRTVLYRLTAGGFVLGELDREDASGGAPGFELPMCEHGSLHSQSRVSWIFVLPDPYRQPARGLE